MALAQARAASTRRNRDSARHPAGTRIASASRGRPRMDDPAFWHRLQFAFTITYHYLFPQLTMGLAGFLVFWKWRALWKNDERSAIAARFWARVFGLTFVVGVVTGIPMEFQFGTNWAHFSRHAGGVIGQTLAMEGMFAFLLESAFVGVLVFGEERVSPRTHFMAAVGVALGSWLSAYFILVTNAFMQHPVGHAVASDGTLVISSMKAYLLNEWALIQFAHNQAAALVTGTFAVTAVGAFYALRGTHMAQARLYLKHGAAAGLVASILVAFPTGDAQAKIVARHQGPTLAAMEGRFESGPLAEITLIGQPNVDEQRLDNPIRIPGMLSFLAYGTFHSDVKGLNDFPRDSWPTNIELLYYAFHVMAGLGTLFIGLMLAANFQQFRGRLHITRSLLWTLALAFPFPFIANTAGWMTTELGRQPWLIYGLFRTSEGYSTAVGAGTVIFTLIGLTGLYFVLGLLYLFLIGREVMHGPDEAGAAALVPPRPAVEVMGG
jgi:cytochrome d ubiquinol oxidase subunit I